MSTINRCRFFYLREITFDLKGELPVYACEKGHEISAECNEACPDFQQTPTQPPTNQQLPPKK